MANYSAKNISIIWNQPTDEKPIHITGFSSDEVISVMLRKSPTRSNVEHARKPARRHKRRKYSEKAVDRRTDH